MILKQVVPGGAKAQENSFELATQTTFFRLLAHLHHDLGGNERKKMLEDVAYGVHRLPLARKRCLFEAAFIADAVSLAFKEALLLELLNKELPRSHATLSAGRDTLHQDMLASRMAPRFVT